MPMDTKGIVKAKKIDKMGMHSSDTGLIFFEDVRVPIKNTVGEEGQGFIYQMLQFQVLTYLLCLSSNCNPAELLINSINLDDFLGREIGGSCWRYVLSLRKLLAPKLYYILTS